MTAQDLIYSALRLLGVLRPGMTGSAEAYADGLQALNDLIGSWNTQALTYFDTPEQQFPLVPGQQSYTWGPGGNFNTTRPAEVLSAGILTSNAGGPGPLRTPLEILTPAGWNEIPVKLVGSTIPTRIYVESSFPLATVWLWPYPTATAQLDIMVQVPASGFATLTTNVSEPPGYPKALKYCLAADLIPYFKGQIKIEAPELDRIEMIAADSLLWVKNQNYTPIDAACDPAILGSPRLWNWMTGDYQR